MRRKIGWNHRVIQSQKFIRSIDGNIKRSIFKISFKRCIMGFVGIFHPIDISWRNKEVQVIIQVLRTMERGKRMRWFFHRLIRYHHIFHEGFIKVNQSINEVTWTRMINILVGWRVKVNFNIMGIYQFRFGRAHFTKHTRKVSKD